MIAFIADLVFRSRMKECLGETVTFLKTESDTGLDIFAADNLVVVDLNLKKQDPHRLIKMIREKYPKMFIIAFGSHVDVDSLDRAKENGATQVMVNSQFVKFLESKRVFTSDATPDPSKDDQRGAGWLTVFVFLSIFGAGTWYLFHLIPVYYKYYELENAMRSITRVSRELNDRDLRERMVAQMRDIGTPGNYRDLIMERSGNEVRVQYQYGEKITVRIFGTEHLIQSFYFNLNVTADPQV